MLNFEAKELIYVAAPYNHPDPGIIEVRMHHITTYLAELSAYGKIAFSPLLMHYCLDKGVDIPGDYEFWRNHCLTLLSKSNLLDVLMLPGWDTSEGVKDEIDFAKLNNIPISYNTRDLRGILLKSSVNLPRQKFPPSV